MKILINGICGFMGREVEKLCRASYRGAELAAGVDPTSTDGTIYHTLDEVPENVDVDCIVDFSFHAVTPALLDYAIERRLPVVIATTGHTPAELDAIRAAAEKIPVFFSANMSLGVALLVELAKRATAALPDADIEIVEIHHNRKLDAPSGTALMLARAVAEMRPGSVITTGRTGQGKRNANEIGVQALRLGNIVGTHEVILGTQNQTITLKHEAHSRALFAEGALAAAEFISRRAPGLYDMNSLVAD